MVHISQKYAMCTVAVIIFLRPVRKSINKHEQKYYEGSKSVLCVSCLGTRVVSVIQRNIVEVDNTNQFASSNPSNLATGP